MSGWVRGTGLRSMRKGTATRPAGSEGLPVGRKQAPAAVAIGLGIFLATLSCGTRVERGAVAESRSPASTEVPGVQRSPAATPGAAPGTVTTSLAPVDRSFRGANQAGSGSLIAGRPSGGAATSQPAAAGTATLDTNELGSGSRIQRPPSGGPTPQPGAVASTPAGNADRLDNSSAPGPRSPVVVASAGTYSGPVGEVLVPILQGTQVWIRSINARGGVNGHVVKLIVYDDGGDPARHRAQVQEAIETRKVVAFLDNNEPVTGGASVDYITSKRVPVIGVSSGEGRWVYGSPMYFPQTSSAQAVASMSAPALAGFFIPQGKTKLGTLVCVEVVVCDDIDRAVAGSAKDVGFQQVYRGKASIAQPDFTAECLSARNAGVQVLLVMLDANAVGRLVTACTRQGFHPNIALYSASVRAGQEREPNFDGTLVVSTVFPHFQTNTPASAEFQRAMGASGADTTALGGPPLGWVAGKLFEKVSANLPEPPTSEALLTGLWSLRDESLGDLTQPLTFMRGQPAQPVSCWFLQTIKDRTWVSPDQFERHCLK